MRDSIRVGPEPLVVGLWDKNKIWLFVSVWLFISYPAKSTAVGAAKSCSFQENSKTEKKNL